MTQKPLYGAVRGCDEWVEAEVQKLGGYHRRCLLNWVEYEHLEMLAGFLTVAGFGDLPQNVSYGAHYLPADIFPCPRARGSSFTNLLLWEHKQADL